MLSADQLDLYLTRIGFAGEASPDGATLAQIVRLHPAAIPFENLDIPLGRGISLDPEALAAKLVTGRRGGYCFEQNGLFGAALRARGFAGRPLLARVWLEAAPAGADVPPRTHMLALVTIDGAEWIADAGFGGSDMPPMRLRDGEETVIDAVHHRLRRDDAFGWMLERDGARQYSFTRDRVFPADLALANHWVSTAPESRFVRLRIASIVTDGGLVSLLGARLSHAGTATDLADPAAYRAMLDERFGIAVTDAEAALLLD